MSDTPERQYNFIFSELVDEPDDLVGLIAYGIYKTEKIDFIKTYKESNDRGPSEAELKNFHQFTNNKSRVAQYRDLAEKILAELQEEMLAERTEAIQEVFESQYKQDIAKAKTSWLASITQSFLGSVIFTFFIGMIVVIIIGWRDGINTIVKESVKLLSGQ